MDARPIDGPYFEPEGPIYFEDFIVNKAFSFGGAVVSRDEIIKFASQFDPQPFHLNEEAGKASMLGGLAASGWHSCVMLQEMAADSFLHWVRSAGSPEILNVEWRRPVYPQDRLTATVDCVETKVDASTPHVGTCHLHYEMFNQNNELVLVMDELRMVHSAPEGGET